MNDRIPGEVAPTHIHIGETSRLNYEGLAAHVSHDLGVDLAHMAHEKPIVESGLDGLHGFARMIEMGRLHARQHELGGCRPQRVDS